MPHLWKEGAREIVWDATGSPQPKWLRNFCNLVGGGGVLKEHRDLEIGAKDGNPWDSIMGTSMGPQKTGENQIHVSEWDTGFQTRLDEPAGDQQGPNIVNRQ